MYIEVQYPTKNTKKYLLSYQKILTHLENNIEPNHYTTNISITFIEQIKYLQFTINKLSKNVLKYSSNAKITHVANNILELHNTYINEFNNTKKLCKKTLNTEAEISSFIYKYNVFSKTILIKMSKAFNINNIELNYLDEILPLIEGIINISTSLLDYNINKTLKKVTKLYIIRTEKILKQIKHLYLGKQV